MRLRLGRIPYANVRPVYYDLDREKGPEWLTCVEAPPTTLNKMLAGGLLDVSPVSSVAYARHFKDWYLLPGLSISSWGKVMSVLLTHRAPLKEISGRPVVLSTESATSVELLKLCLERKGISPVYKTEKVDNPKGLAADTAGALVIGDKALKWRWDDEEGFMTDLGDCWYQWTGLPFVFAVWAVRRSFVEKNRPLVRQLVEILHQSLKNGLSDISSIAENVAFELEMRTEKIEEYYRCIKYALGSNEQKALLEFFHMMYEKKTLEREVSIEFF